ncbi:MAG TPA: hypothetical protein VGE68_02900 [Sphingomicrobium sp.]
MQSTVRVVFAAAIMLSPVMASAQTAPGQGQYNGTGYWHSNSGNAYGQPGLECDEVGAPPGHTATAPGSAFNPNGNAGTHYAGEQPQNSRNTASVSQYDVGCRDKTSK